MSFLFFCEVSCCSDPPLGEELYTYIRFFFDRCIHGIRKPSSVECGIKNIFFRFLQEVIKV